MITYKVYNVKQTVWRKVNRWNKILGTEKAIKYCLEKMGFRRIEKLMELAMYK